MMYVTAKFLAKIMKPLVGLNSHHIVNSEDFVNKIAELEVPPGQKLVSYDVSSLFTSIPINEAIPVVRAKLESDQSLPDRCPLDIAQLSVLQEMCLSSTYFTFQGEFYKQKKGAAMGSPISPVVANAKRYTVKHFKVFVALNADCPVKRTTGFAFKRGCAVVMLNLKIRCIT